MSSVNKDPIKEIERNLDTAPLPTFPCAAPFEPVPWLAEFYPAETEATSAPVPRVGGNTSAHESELLMNDRAYRESVAASPVAPESQTIDTPELAKLLDNWMHDARRGYPFATSRTRLVSHIAAQVARPLPTDPADRLSPEIIASVRGKLEAAGFKPVAVAAAVGALPAPKVCEAYLLGALSEFTDAMPPGGLTKIGFDNSMRALRAAVAFYISQPVNQALPAPAAQTDDAELLQEIDAMARETDRQLANLDGPVDPELLAMARAALPAPVVATEAQRQNLALVIERLHTLMTAPTSTPHTKKLAGEALACARAVEVARQPDEPSTFSHSSNPLEHMPTMGARYAYYVKHPDGSHSYAVPQPTLLKPEYRNGCFAAPSSQAAPTYAGRVPLSVDGKSVFIDGVGDVALNYDAASSQAAPDAKAEPIHSARTKGSELWRDVSQPDEPIAEIVMESYGKRICMYVGWDELPAGTKFYRNSTAHNSEAALDAKDDLNLRMVKIRLKQIVNPAPDSFSAKWHATDALYYLTGEAAYAKAADDLAAAPSQAAPAATAELTDEQIEVIANELGSPRPSDRIGTAYTFGAQSVFYFARAILAAQAAQKGA